MRPHTRATTWLLLAVLAPAPAFASAETCERAGLARTGGTRDTARREAKRYLACISKEDAQDDCAPRPSRA